jgi:hypothetical protein
VDLLCVDLGLLLGRTDRARACLAICLRGSRHTFEGACVSTKWKQVKSKRKWPYQSSVRQEFDVFFQAYFAHFHGWPGVY